MKLSRRDAIAGVAVALAGCSGLETEIEQHAERVRSIRDHPLSGTTSVSIVNRSGSRHDLDRLTAEALTYWTANAVEYTGYEVSFELTTTSPDLEIIFLESRNELRGCREHATQGVLGCAPLLEAEHRPELPVTVEVVAGARPYGGILVTVKHELGHTLGLTHENEPAHVMSNEIEDRLPEYARRTKILDAVESAWSDQNAGTREYNRAIERWNDGEYGPAASEFKSGIRRYRLVIPSVAIADELEDGFDGMDRPETVDRESLRRYISHMREWIELAMTRSELMADAAKAREAGDRSTASDRVSAATEPIETLRTVRFPSPADVARALGLLRDGRTDTTADEPDDMSTVLHP